MISAPRQIKQPTHTRSSCIYPHGCYAQACCGSTVVSTEASCIVYPAIATYGNPVPVSGSFCLSPAALLRLPPTSSVVADLACSPERPSNHILTSSQPADRFASFPRPNLHASSCCCIRMGSGRYEYNHVSP